MGQNCTEVYQTRFVSLFEENQFSEEN